MHLENCISAQPCGGPCFQNGALFLKRALSSRKGLALLKKFCFLETALVFRKRTSFSRRTIFSRKGLALLKRALLSRKSPGFWKKILALKTKFKIKER